MELLAIRYRNTKLFRDVFFRLDYPGIVGVQGKNLNSRQVADNDDTNGVGKSLLLNGIPLVLFERMTTSSPAKSKGSFFSKNNAGDIRLWLRKDGDIYMIELDSGGKYSLFKNGESYSAQGKRLKISDAAAMIEQLVGISEKEYHTRIAVSLQNSDFLRNKGSDRVDTLAYLFGFSHFDDLSLLLKKYAEEKGLTKLTGKLESCASRLQRATDNVNRYPCTLQDYQESLSVIAEELAALREVSPNVSPRELAFAKKRSEELRLLIDSLLDAKELQEAESHLASLKKELADASSVNDQLRAYELAKHQLLELERTFKATLRAGVNPQKILSDIEASTVDLDTENFVAGINAAYSSFFTDLSVAGNTLSNMASFRSRINDLFSANEHTLQSAASAELFVSQWKSCIAANQESDWADEYVDLYYDALVEVADSGLLHTAVESILDLLDVFLKSFEDDGGREPLTELNSGFMLELDSNLLSAIAVEYKEAVFVAARYKKLSAEGATTCHACGSNIELDNAKTYAEQWEAYAQNLDSLQTSVEAKLANWRRKELNKQADRVANYERFLVGCQLLLHCDIWEQASPLVSTLMDKPVLVNITEITSLISEWEEYIAPTKKHSRTALESELEAVTAVLSAESDIEVLAENQRAISALQVEYDETTRTCALLEAATAELAAAREEMKLLETHKIDSEAVSFLKSFYAPGGARTDMLEDSALRLEAAYNEHKHLLYGEDSSFLIQPNDKSLAIIWKRNGGNEDDVWDSSGSERRRFDLLNLLCLNMLLPPPSYVVLDEMESALGDANVGTYLDQYLPQLLSVVPTVFLISPLKKVVSAADATITVTKDGQYSTIEVSDPQLQVKQDLIDAGYGEFL